MERYHIEVSVSISSSYSKLTNKDFDVSVNICILRALVIYWFFPYKYSVLFTNYFFERIGFPYISMKILAKRLLDMRIMSHYL